MVATKDQVLSSMRLAEVPPAIRSWDGNPQLRILNDRGTSIGGRPYQYDVGKQAMSGLAPGSIIFESWHGERLYPGAALRLPIEERFESFDSTTLGGEPDPVWSVAAELGEALAEINVLTRRAEALVRRLEALPAVDDLSDSDDEDAVVFGAPKRKVHVRGRLVGSRRGEPLIVAEDFGE